MATKTKILAVDDDANICDLLRIFFENEGYEVKTANDGVEGVNLFKMYEPDLVLLDIMLPKKDGWQVCREIRENSSKPVIMITAKGEVFDKVLGLELGADDFVVKPFDMKELLARIRAMTRVLGVQPDSTLVCGNVRLDVSSHDLTGPEGSYKLAGKEYQVMEMLMRNPRTLISTETFMDRIWGYDSEAELNNVWVYISTLRKKLKAIGADIEIKAQRGVGYCLEVRS